MLPIPPRDDIPHDCVVFDTETTGMDAEGGDRIVEIGAVRLRGLVPTGETFHAYINPERTVPEAAAKVHGLTSAFLSDKPLFSEVAHDFRAFIGADPLVAHNAGFDAAFLNAEVRRLGFGPLPAQRFVDTVPIARKRFPGAQANLDALCRRFKISLKDRTTHGALIDSELLAEVCLELSGGRQISIFDDLSAPGARRNAAQTGMTRAPAHTRVVMPTDAERAAHTKAIAAHLGDKAIWATHAMAAEATS